MSSDVKPNLYVIACKPKIADKLTSVEALWAVDLLFSGPAGDVMPWNMPVTADLQPVPVVCTFFMYNAYIYINVQIPNIKGLSHGHGCCDFNRVGVSTRIFRIVK